MRKPFITASRLSQPSGQPQCTALLTDEISTMKRSMCWMSGSSAWSGVCGGRLCDLLVLLLWAWRVPMSLKRVTKKRGNRLIE
jgi:hypothetical protein